ncbi:MAG: hypothetical protein WC816_09460 [Sphingomonas sp.]|jgi:hypothetical protein
MKLLTPTAALALSLAAPAMAQTGAPAAAEPATPAVATKFSLDTPIETIVADPKGKAVIEADIPPLTSHPAFDQFKSMSLRALQPLSGGAISDDLLKKVETDLASIK